MIHSRAKEALRKPFLDRSRLAAVVLPDKFLADACAVALCLLVVVLVTSTPIGSGDYGQWLMVSRYYAGDGIPDYRVIAALPPLVPIWIAVVHQVVTDPILALTIVKVTLAIALVLLTYWAGTAAFDDRIAGLLGAATTFFIADRMLEPFAFGGLLQLGALTFLTFAMGAYAKALRAQDFKLRWWVLGAAGIALAILSHTGTGVLALLIGGAVAGGAALTKPGLTRGERVAAFAPLVVAVLALAPYWVLVILPNNTEYASNTASLHYRGPEALWLRLSVYQLNVVVVGGGLAALAFIVLQDWRQRHLQSSLILGGWFMAMAAFLALSIIRGVGTEYPRFIYPLLQPLALAFGGGLSLLIAFVARRLLPENSTTGATILGVALVSVILIAIGPATATSYRREARAYRMEELQPLLASFERVDAEMPPEQSVLSIVSAGKWVEGVTGRAGLFAIPNRFSFRPAERERAQAADVILRSTLSASNGQVQLRYTRLANGQPIEPWIGINHWGEYVDLIRVSQFDTVVTSPGESPVRLDQFEVTGFESTQPGDDLSITTDFLGSIGGEEVRIHQRAFIEKNESSVFFSYEIKSAREVGLQVSVLPIGAAPWDIQTKESELTMRFARRAGTYPEVQVRPLGQNTKARFVTDEIRGGASAVVSSDRPGVLEFEVGFSANAEALNTPAFYWPQRMVEAFNVGAVYLPIDSALTPRMLRLEALGFEYREQAGRFILMVRPSRGAEVDVAP